MNDLTHLSLFTGIGGIDLAAEAAGFKTVCQCEWADFQTSILEKRWPRVPRFRDITTLTKEVFFEKTGRNSVTLISGGFPCQPFSSAGKQKGFEDTRGTLFFDICRIIKEKRPSVVFLENVKHLVHHNKGNTLSTILDKLQELGYKVSWKVLNGADFGVPQNRERIIIIAALSKKFDFKKVKTVSRKNLIDFLDSEGNFEYLSPHEYTLIENPKKQPLSGLIFAGYRNKSIRKAGVRPNTLHLSRVHKQPNRIYSVQGIHPTLPSQEVSGRYFILTEEGLVRKLTLNECWRIMGFPDSYVKVSSVAEQYKQLGNSVCVPMISAVAREIKNQFFMGNINE